MTVCVATETIRIADVLFVSSVTSIDRTTSGRRLTSLPFVLLLAFMLAAIDVLSVPSEHSELVQNCDDDDGVYRRALIKSDIECFYSFVSSSFLLQTSGNGTIQLDRQAQSMNTVVLNTRKLVFKLSLLAFSGMLNKHTYSTCIKTLIPYVVMFIHLTTSTAIRAVDDLQSN